MTAETAVQASQSGQQADIARPGVSAEAIYAALRDAIGEQALKPGQKLPEDMIGEQFGVSRTIVRAAFSRLAAERLIDLKRNRGAFVASPSIEEARAVFQARRCIEREIAAMLAGRLSATQVKALRSHVAREHAAEGKEGGRLSIRLSGEFHLLLARYAGNGVLEGFLVELVSRSSLILALYGRRNAGDCAGHEHEALIRALGDGDGAAAAAEMDRHLLAVEAALDLSPPEPAAPDLSAILKRYARPGRASPLEGGSR
ncbi:MAG: GntR family transcriptional regulator [Thalassobaculales bacterium]